jgi:predicted 2-oxoglutarate/Fe(II)-dependent dioxygenase YbiX
MSDKKRWQPKDSSDDEGRAPWIADRAEAAALAMTQVNAAMRHADGAMRQADDALAAAGLHGKANYGPAAAAMREAERLERKSTEAAQIEVERAMARASRAEYRAEEAEREAE